MGAKVIRQGVDDGEFASRGEEIAARHLERQLPDHWWIICNKELLSGRRVREIDFIIVADKALYAIDEKSWAGDIYGNGSAWVLPDGDSNRSPINKANARARELAGFLRRDVPINSDTEFVYGKVLLSANNVINHVNDPRSETDVLRLLNCGEALKAQHKVVARKDFPSTIRTKIISSLCDLSYRPRLPKKIHDYTIVQDLKVSDYALHLKGRHDDGSFWLLKVIGKPFTANEDTYEHQKEVLLREYSSLRKLEHTRRAPIATPYLSWNSGDYWVVPMTFPDGVSLETAGQRGRPDAGAAWRVVKAAFEGLCDIHSNGVIHRALTPDRIFLSANDWVSFDGFVITRIKGRNTISEWARDIEPETEFTAPECTASVAYATEKSDVYGLSASLLAWCGMDPRRPDQSALAPGLEQVAEFLIDRMKHDEKDRTTAIESLVELKRIRERV